LWEGRERGKLKAFALRGMLIPPFQALWLGRIGPFIYPEVVLVVLSIKRVNEVTDRAILIDGVP
jgi:hypothetical protein